MQTSLFPNQPNLHNFLWRHAYHILGKQYLHPDIVQRIVDQLKRNFDRSGRFQKERKAIILLLLMRLLFDKLSLPKVQLSTFSWSWQDIWWAVDISMFQMQYLCNNTHGRQQHRWGLSWVSRPMWEWRRHCICWRSETSDAARKDNPAFGRNRCSHRCS